MGRSLSAICFGLALAWSLGCGSSTTGQVSMAEVKGTATMDGKSIAKGELHFSTV